MRVGSNPFSPALAAVLLLASLTVMQCCTHIEREALLDLKEGLQDSAGRLSSWTGADCCKWPGVGCDNSTGGNVVVKLDIGNPRILGYDDYGVPVPDIRWSFRGELRPSILHLRHLNYLDLSMNPFSGGPIPAFLGSLERLVHLNLSQTGFTGAIPTQLGNLSSLTHLDISRYRSVYGYLPFAYAPLMLDDVWWLSRLSSLQHLNMRDMMLRGGADSDLLLALNMLPSISELHLVSMLPPISELFPSLPHVNFTSLSVLDLSHNAITSIPHWLFNITRLEYLILQDNQITGHIPAEFGNMISLKHLDLSANRYQEGGVPATFGNLCNLQELYLSNSNIIEDIAGLKGIFTGCMKETLEVLDISDNMLSGNLPDWLGELENLKGLHLQENELSGSVPESIGRLSSLQELRIGNNKLNGTIPKSLGGLSNLISLDLRANNLQGVVSESILSGLENLDELNLSLNNLTLNVSHDWVPPFILSKVGLGSCRLGPRFPTWLRLAVNLVQLDLSNNNISGNIPGWYWNSINRIGSLDLSKNSIQGEVPKSMKHLDIFYVNLASNSLEGSLTLFSSTITTLVLSNNLFSGPIMPDIGDIMPNLDTLSLSSNSLSGTIPSSICKLEVLRILDLSNNKLVGEFPDCRKNSVSGGVLEPTSSLSELDFLQLNGNNLSGELPVSLKDCDFLQILDLSNNSFSGSIPVWVPQNLPSLKVLSLRSNMFSGEVHQELSNSPSLQVLDLAHNNLTGSIPHSFGNFRAMMKTDHGRLVGVDAFNGLIATYYDVAISVVKSNREMEYLSQRLTLVVSIDLSCNSLWGEIPQEVGDLHGLQVLNLSQNHLTGMIPSTFDKLQFLESLDLSINNISGNIPPSMSTLTFLSHMNLSYNNLSGSIPTGNQFSTFDPSIYSGNSHLCGSSLAKSCEGNGYSHQDSPSKGEAEEDRDKSETLLWFYLSMVLGFVFGFWVFCGTLLFKRTWRYGYFRLVDRMFDWVSLKSEMNWIKLQRTLRRS